MSSLSKADFRNMYEALVITRNDLKNALQNVEHSIERFKARSEAPVENLGEVRAKSALEDIKRTQEINRKLKELGVSLHPFETKSSEEE